jgi:hypothetical protein
MHANPLPSFEFTADQLRVLADRQGEPLHVPVKELNRVYLVIEEGVVPTLDEDFIRAGLALAGQQVERGEEGPWSSEEIKAAGRKWLAERQSKKS